MENNKPESQIENLSEVLQVRRDKLSDLQKMGRDPFKISKYDVTHHSNEVIDQYDSLEGQRVSLAGRIMSKRIMGKASFMHLQDQNGRIQAYVKRDDIGLDEYKLFKTYDIGDIVGIEGFVFKTKTEEVSVHVEKLVLLSKSLQVLPEKYHGLKDVDLRYRQRYVDLIVNPEVKDAFLTRTKALKALRSYLDERGFLEVETPILNTIAGGANARPFITHHNTLDIPMYLRIANELYLKRLIVGGFDKVYEMGRMFRNEGMDRTHNPEFTAMEVYVAYKDYFWMMGFTEKLVEAAALAVNGTTELRVGDRLIDFKPPYARVRMTDAIKEHAGFDIEGKSEEEIRRFCGEAGLEIDETMGKGKLIDEIFGAKCEANYIQPTFVYDYPKEMSPLTKKHRENPELTERFELFVNGKELANAYSELNDPIDQLERFQQQLRLQERGDEEAMFIDYDFVRALEYGMPPASGMGIGIDRLCMFLTDSPSIQDVLLFPQMKPEHKERTDADEKFMEAGIPQEWVAPLKKTGIVTVEALKKVENFNKLHQSLCGMNKKEKLGLTNPKPEEVAAWIHKN